MSEITIALVGRLADKQPPYRLVSIGLVLLAASFAVMITVDTLTPLWLLVAWAILGRIGLGFILPSLNLGSMRGVDHSLISQGSSVINFVRMLGGATGVSLCGIGIVYIYKVHRQKREQAADHEDRLDPAAFMDDK